VLTHGVSPCLFNGRCDVQSDLPNGHLFVPPVRGAD
jgi:hypothetical protein